MKKSILILLTLVFISCTVMNTTPSKNQEQRIISQPVSITEEGHDFHGTENILFVPENRSNPKSRDIGLHFFHFPAKEKSDLPPIAFLGAGPGEPYDIERFYKSKFGSRAEAWTWELSFVNQKRDLILINQRGNSDAPGLQIEEFIYRWKNGSLDAPFDLELRNENRRDALKERVDFYTKQGMDLRGYDIHNFVDDIESIRTYFGYNKMAFIGTSFGSQWGLAYAQKYTEHVDRAIFAGLEPLDHAYDDPEGIWNVLEKIEKLAMADPKVAKDLPEVGLLEALKIVIQRLKDEPQIVEVVVPSEDLNEQVIIGVGDLRFSLDNPFARGRVERIESWPKYITELYNGDFRALAYEARYRRYTSVDLIMAPLVDNSLGISAERNARLDASEASNWLGDINLYHKRIKEVAPTKDVGDNFRQQKRHSIPMILIQGDMDRSTPYENATELMEYLENGHLLTIRGGMHSAKRAFIFADSTLAVSVYEFMNQDFEQINIKEYQKTLPTNFDLAPFEFWKIEGESIFDAFLKNEND